MQHNEGLFHLYKIRFIVSSERWYSTASCDIVIPLLFLLRISLFLYTWLASPFFPQRFCRRNINKTITDIISYYINQPRRQNLFCIDIWHFHHSIVSIIQKIECSIYQIVKRQNRSVHSRLLHCISCTEQYWWKTILFSDWHRHNFPLL